VESGTVGSFGSEEERLRVQLDDVAIEVAVDGPAGGRPVLLLHGFPDSGRVWRYQLPALVDAGFRVIVPDLRGYGGSDKPEGVAAYGAGRLLRDVAGVLGHLDVARNHLVGHDWGASLAWAVAMSCPSGSIVSLCCR
jgi:pimeloyl-ACP methyl ester carboxylesterase